MNTDIDSNRLLTLVGPNNCRDVLPIELTGTEGRGIDFHFELVCLLRPQSSVNVNDWLSKPVTVSLHQRGQPPKIINGLVHQYHQRQGESHCYEVLDIVPWFNLLGQQYAYRIYQHQSVVDIYQTVCQAFAVVDFDVSQLGKAYPKIDYCVQYNETAQDFLRRLLFSAGIDYTYQHSDEKHTMVLRDANSPHPEKAVHLPVNDGDVQVPSLSHWREAVSVSTDEQCEGESHLLSLTPNQRFIPEVLNAPARPEHCIIQLWHTAQDVSQTNHRAKSGKAQYYQNTFVAYPTTHAYCPARLAPPKTPGPEPATVVGPAGESIYTDTTGRVKVQFPWDKHGHYNENSSRWLAVMQWQADTGWGTQFIPRLGDTVLVDFDDANPDKPRVIGSVYQKNAPIFSADNPRHAISGLKTQLIGENAIAGEGHRLRFNDTPGQAQLSLSSAGDLTVSVKQHLSQTTDKDEYLTVKGEQLLQVFKGNTDIQAKRLFLTSGQSEVIIDDTGVQLKPSGQVYLKASGVKQLQPLARLGDKHHCPKRHTDLSPHGTEPIKQGSSRLKVNGLGAAKLLSPIPCGGKLQKKLLKTITVEGQPLASVGSQTDHGGLVVKGSPNVLVGPRAPIEAHRPQSDKPNVLLKPDDVADIIYITGDDDSQGENTFYALTEQDAKALEQAAEPLMNALKALWEVTNKKIQATDKATIKAHQQAIVKAKQQVNAQLQSSVKGPKEIELTEIIHFKAQKRTYITSNKMKNHWRRYRLDKTIKTRSRVKKIQAFYQKMQDSDGKLSQAKIKTAVAKALQKPPTTFTLVEINHVAVWKDFTTHVGNRYFQADAQAQLLRASAGGAITGEWSPATGRLSFSAEGHADCALAQGQLNVQGYIPSRVGWHIDVWLENKHHQPTKINLGSVRCQLSATLTGFVGASVAASANLNLLLAQKGKAHCLTMQGNHQPSSKTRYAISQAAKSKQEGLHTQANAFAGIKLGADTNMGIAWQNPDINANIVKGNGDASAGWQPFGSLNAEGSVAMGAGIGVGFQIGFEPRAGKFIIRGHAEVVMGFGVSGDFGVVVEAEHIVEFVAFVYHKLKDNNFSFMGFITKRAFVALTSLLTKLIFSEVDLPLEKLALDGINHIINWWDKIFTDIKANKNLLNLAEQFASGINQRPEKLMYTPPEVKGRMLALFTQPNLQAKIEQQARDIVGDMALGQIYLPEKAANLAKAQVEQLQQAIVHILSYVQSQADFKNVIQHMTLDGTRAPDANYRDHEKQLYQGLGFYGRQLAEKDPHVESLIKQLQADTVYPASTKPNTPIEVNKGVARYV